METATKVYNSHKKKTIQDRRDEIVQKWEHAIEEAKRSGKQ